MYKVGDLVEVYIPESVYKDSDIITALARKYNREMHYISKRKEFRNADGIKVGSYVELEDCTASTGIPYSFDIEWIRVPED